MAVYAVGDVQGCGDELEALLRRIEFTPGRDRLWLTGDLVNRGPRSLDVLRLVQGLGIAAVTVLGNHDVHLLGVMLAGERVKASDTLGEVLAAPDRDALCAWLRRRPLLHEDAALGLTMVHAGLPPQWDAATTRACAREGEAALADDTVAPALLRRLSAGLPDRWSATLTGLDRLAFIVSCFTELRVCDATGRVAWGYNGPPDEAPPGLHPWFRLPGRRSRHLRLVVGHWSALGFHDGDGVLAIDTGCVWGGRLCAVRLDGPEPPVFEPCTARVPRRRAGEPADYADEAGTQVPAADALKKPAAGKAKRNKK
jgi:bis(5'-nucleosyl)-tetraphosphatase (symmetrical)